MVLRFLLRWRVAPERAIISVAAYAFFIMSLCALAAQATGRLAGMVAQLAPALTGSPSQPKSKSADAHTATPQKAAMSLPQTRAQGSVILTQGWSGLPGNARDRSNWRHHEAWRRRDRDRDSDDWWRSRDGDDNDERRPEQSTTYRTICVRLCDGYYWPISYATTPESFDRDRQKCESKLSGVVA